MRRKHLIGAGAMRIAAVTLLAVGIFAVGGVVNLPANVYAEDGDASQPLAAGDAVATEVQDAVNLVASNATQYMGACSITETLDEWHAFADPIEDSLALSVEDSKLNDAQQRMIDAYFEDSGQIQLGVIDVGGADDFLDRPRRPARAAPCGPRSYRTPCARPRGRP